MEYIGVTTLAGVEFGAPLPELAAHMTFKLKSATTVDEQFCSTIAQKL